MLGGFLSAGWFPAQTSKGRGKPLGGRSFIARGDEPDLDPLSSQPLLLGRQASERAYVRRRRSRGV